MKPALDPRDPVTGRAVRGLAGFSSVSAVELRHLRYFVAVAEELHFRRAAERLHISQPPLSQQIRQLEDAVGVQLLARNRRGVQLTPAGQSFLEEAREILASVDDAAETARRVSRGEVGQLSVGFVGSAMYGVLPEILRSFREGHPDVELRLRELPSAPQLEGLRSGRIDVGFVRPPVQDPDLMSETVLREPVVAALPEWHRLSARRRLRLADLRHESFVLMGHREAPGLHDALVGAMWAAGSAPGVIQEVAEMQTVVGLVAAGLGVSLVPASVQALKRRGVVYRPVIEDAPRIELDLVWRTGDASPVLDAFRQLVRAHPA
jgi:DNA-binding transcriptional LysR family regulator